MSRSRYSKDVRALNPVLDDPQVQRRNRAQVDMADVLLDLVRVHAPDLDGLVRDHPFQTFRVDLAWPDLRLGFEVNGGYHAKGGGKHGTVRDHQKVQDLVLDGWTVLVFSAAQVRQDPLDVMDRMRRARVMVQSRRE